MTPRHLHRRASEWAFPPAAFVSEIVVTAKQARAVVRRFENVEPKVPPQIELDSLVRDVWAQWRRSASLDALAPRTKRRLPWVLFYPANDVDQWPASDESLGNHAFASIAAQSRPAAIASLIRVLLQKYPRDWHHFEVWIGRAGRLVQESHSIRLTRWKTRHAQFGVLDADAPGQLADRWLSWSGSKEEFLEETGLEETGAESGIRTAVNHEVLKRLSSLLSEQRTSAVELEKRIALLISDSGRFTSDSLRLYAAHLLLHPFQESDGIEGTKEVIRTFLLMHIGDPRIKPGSWNPVPLEDRKVLLRWLVADTLEDFFRLLDRTALDRHWQQRKEFWQAYLRRNVITDAWLVLGPDARTQARSVFGSAGGTWGLLGGVGDRSQSVLIMKLGGMTIVEWSHNGSCRLWREGVTSAPKLYQRKSDRSELTSNSADERITHDASGRWKDKISRFIRRETGIAWRNK